MIPHTHPHELPHEFPPPVNLTTRATCRLRCSRATAKINVASQAASQTKWYLSRVLRRGRSCHPHCSSPTVISHDWPSSGAEKRTLLLQAQPLDNHIALIATSKISHL